MKKYTILSKTIAAAASLAILATAAHAASFVNGTTGADELFIGVHATGGTGSGKSVVIDVGSAYSLSQLTAGQTQSLGSIGADLEATFGVTAGSATAWYNRTDLVWSAVAASVTATGSELASTLYGGISANGLYPLTTTAYNRTTGSTQNTIGGRILNNMANASAGQGGFHNAATGATSNIAVEAASDVNGYATWMPGGTNTSLFGGFSNPAGTAFEQAFATGTLASGYEGALDVYRMTKTATADPDNSATAGAGVYQFTVAINSSGSLIAEDLPLSSVPEPASLGSLFSAALLGIGALRRKRGAKVQA